MIDRITKIFLGMIAVGLWANVLVSLYHPITAAAQGRGQLDYIATDVDALKGFVENIASGQCINRKICSGSSSN